jgi:hypothetical protein
MTSAPSVGLCASCRHARVIALEKFTGIWHRRAEPPQYRVNFVATIRLSSESRSSTRFLGTSLLVHNPQFHPLGDLAQRRFQRIGDFP